MLPFPSSLLVYPTPSFTPPSLYIPLPLSLFPSTLSSSGLLFPPPFLLMSHQSSPTRSRTDPRNWQRSHPLYYWHELDSTVINGNGSAVTHPWKNFWYLWQWHTEWRKHLVWMKTCLINWNKALRVSHIETDTSPSLPSHFILPFSFSVFQSFPSTCPWPLLQGQFWNLLLLSSSFLSHFLTLYTVCVSPLPFPSSVLHS